MILRGEKEEERERKGQAMKPLHWVTHTHLSHSHWNDQEYLHNLWALSTQPVWLWFITRFENKFSDHLHQLHTHSLHRICKKLIPSKIKETYTPSEHQMCSITWVLWTALKHMHDRDVLLEDGLNASQSKAIKLKGQVICTTCIRSACWPTFTEMNYCLK